MDIKQDIKEIRKLNEESQMLVNEVAKEANKELKIARYKIICQTVLIALLAILGAFISVYSIYTQKEVLYNMQVDKKVVEEKTKVENLNVSSDNNGKAVGILGSNNEVSN